jgi:hypothetical protein
MPSSVMDRVMQEFYCNDCDGYIMIQITANMHDKKVVIVCPECDRKHPRTIKKGQIIDNSHSSESYEICPVLSAYSKTPRTSICKVDARDGAVVQNHDALMAKAILDESKADKGWFGKKFRRNK